MLVTMIIACSITMFLVPQVPYMVAVGNHEYDYEGGSKNDPTGQGPYKPSE